jgi:hypothetical protein
MTTDRLPWRVDTRLAAALGGDSGEIQVRLDEQDQGLTLRGVLPRPAVARVSLILRIHSSAGIPLASASISLSPGDRSFEAPIAFLAMEGYSHFAREKREAIERRVWLRRAFASAAMP